MPTITVVVSAIGTPELTKTFLIWIQPNSSSFIAPFLETTQYSLGPFLKWEYLDKALPSNILLRKGPEGNFCPYLHNMRCNYHSNLLLSALVLKWKRGWGVSLNVRGVLAPFLSSLLEVVLTEHHMETSQLMPQGLQKKTGSKRLYSFEV